MDIIESSDTLISVRFRGFPRQYINALRRISISEIPIMAIDDVIVHYNSSIMHDEALVHRIGLIPLRMELNRFATPDECTCKSSLGCSNCRVMLYLDVDAANKSRQVLSGDMISDDTIVKPINPNIPIVNLVLGQKIKIEAYARLGKGKMHAKWQPVSVAVLKEVNELDNEYILTLESVGSLTAKEILLESARVLLEKLKRFENNIIKLKEEEYAKSNTS